MNKFSLKLSVIIVNWNTKELLRKSIQSVYDIAGTYPYEVIVIDNASDDGSADMVADEFRDVMLVRSKENLGFSAGNNVGMQLASGEYFLLLNPDAELKTNAVRNMIEFADEHPRAAFIGPKLLNSDGSLQKNGRKFPSFLREISELTRIHKWFWNYYDLNMGWGRVDFDKITQVDEVSGACILARKAAVDEIGLLDERFFMYYEETDWCKRAKKAGWEVYYLPTAEVIHHWAAGAKQIGLKGSRIFHRSQYLYFGKHHGIIQAFILKAASSILMLVLQINSIVKRARK